MDNHDPYCAVYDFFNGGQEKVLNNAKPCTCGYRKQQEQERHTRRVRNRYVPPLHMTDAEFLRTMRIKPEGE